MAPKIDAATWLTDYLRENGKTEVSQTMRDAKEAGYARREIREAKFNCGIQTSNNWKMGSGATKWFWALLEDNNA